MSYKVDNAIIMAAGLSSRFAPLSYEGPKALITVKGEVLIERQIRQLQEAGIKEIILVVGYRKEQFYYLKEKFGITIVENTEYSVRNNNSSIYAVREYLKNSYICSADNYFSVNPFEREVEESYYSAIYAEGETKEWCLTYDEEGWIKDVVIGGTNQWYMLGHVFWSENFSKRFVEILNEIYDLPETTDKLWESIYMEHLEELNLKIRKYNTDVIYEFDSLDELREFDSTYIEDTCSEIIKYCAKELKCKESDLTEFVPLKNEDGQVYGCSFIYKENKYIYDYEKAMLERMESMNADNSRVKELLEQYIGELEIKEITRMGGLTNRTYKADTTKGVFVVRIPGEGTEEIIVRSDEKKSTELACDLGIDAKLYYFDGVTGEKITDYILDSVTMNAETLRENENIEKCADIFRTLHTSDVDTQVPFDVIEMSDTYEDFISRHGGSFYEDFQEVKQYINDIKNSYMLNVKKVPCHNDALCENWIRQGETMYLIDWEYAGMNDPMWDLADVSIEADFSEENDRYFLECYFGREATEQEEKAFLINKVLIDYLWSLWGKTRAVYDGEEMEEYARVRYERMKNTMKSLGE